MHINNVLWIHQDRSNTHNDDARDDASMDAFQSSSSCNLLRRIVPIQWLDSVTVTVTYAFDHAERQPRKHDDTVSASCRPKKSTLS